MAVSPGASLQQPHLPSFGWSEQVAAQLEPGLAKAVPPGGKLEARAHQLGPGPLPAHPAEETGIIVAAAAKRLDGCHHLAGAIGIVGVEPGAKQRRDLVRQSNRKEESAARSGAGRGLDDRFELVVGDLRNDRSDGDVRRHSRLRQRTDRREPPGRRRSAGLERSASAGSSEVTDRATAASPLAAAGAIRSRSRSTRSDLVVMVNGWSVATSSSSSERVTRQRPSIG